MIGTLLFLMNTPKPKNSQEDRNIKEKKKN
jgi:hypothetical protein